MSKVVTTTILECVDIKGNVSYHEGHLDCDSDFNSNKQIIPQSTYIESMADNLEGFWCTSTIDLIQHFRSVKITKHKTYSDDKNNQESK